jgi:hypothetical protein
MAAPIVRNYPKSVLGWEVQLNISCVSIQLCPEISANRLRPVRRSFLGETIGPPATDNATQFCVRLQLERIELGCASRC